MTEEKRENLYLPNKEGKLQKIHYVFAQAPNISNKR